MLAAYLGGVQQRWNGRGATQIPEQRQRFVAVIMRAHDAHLRNATIIQRLDILPSRRSERVVRAAPSTFREDIFFRIRTREQRKLGYPKKVRSTGRGIESCGSIKSARKELYGPLLTHHGTQPTQPGEAFASQALLNRPNKEIVERSAFETNGTSDDSHLRLNILFTDPYDITWSQL